MLDHLHAASYYQTKLLWAPGLDLSSLTREELQSAWAISNYIVINEAEWQWARDILGGENPEWSRSLRAVVVTCAARGCVIYQDKREPLVLPAIAPERIIDPTGCGDAFVAGFAYGLISDLDLLTCAQIGSSLSSFNLESRGTQHHACTTVQVRDRLRTFYGNERSR
jgi:adenosine kinase